MVEECKLKWWGNVISKSNAHFIYIVKYIVIALYDIFFTHANTAPFCPNPIIIMDASVRFGTEVTLRLEDSKEDDDFNFSKAP